MQHDRLKEDTMAEFTVTSGELTAKAAELERLNHQLKQKIEVLQTEEGSLKTMWEGDAKEAFSRSFHTDKAKMMQFHTEIGKYVFALRTVAARYEAAERINVSTAGAK